MMGMFKNILVLGLLLFGPFQLCSQDTSLAQPSISLEINLSSFRGLVSESSQGLQLELFFDNLSPTPDSDIFLAFTIHSLDGLGNHLFEKPLYFGRDTVRFSSISFFPPNKNCSDCRCNFSYRENDLIMSIEGLESMIAPFAYNILVQNSQRDILEKKIDISPGKSYKIPIENPSISIWEYINEIILQNLPIGIALLLGLIVVFILALNDKVKEWINSLFSIIEIPFRNWSKSKSNKKKLNEYQERLEQEINEFYRTGEFYQSTNTAEDGYFSSNSKILKQPKSGKKLKDDRVISILKSAIKGGRKFFIIVGEPGSGKTTLLKHILFKMAKNDAEAIFGISDHFIPIYIPLKHFSSSGNQSIIEYINEKYLNADKDSSSFFSKILEKGHSFLLLDGLDEISNTTKREEVIREIIHQINKYEKKQARNGIFVTCRYKGIENQLNEFIQLELLALSYNDIPLFIKERYGHPQGALEDVQRSKIDNLVDQLEGHNLLNIATNPMLLSLIWRVSDEFENLPQNKSDLYLNFIKKSIYEIYSHPEPEDLGKIIDLLDIIAYTFWEEDSDQILFHNIIKQENVNEHNDQLQELNKKLDSRRGIIMKDTVFNEQPVLRFAHPTFKEFLVARHIHRFAEHQNLIFGNIDNENWEEVIIFYSGLCNHPKELLNSVLDKGVTALEDLHERRLVLAGNCIRNAKDCDEQVFKELLEEILNRLSGDTYIDEEKLIDSAALLLSDKKMATETYRKEFTNILIQQIV